MGETKDLRIDPKSGLALPPSVFEDRHQQWLSTVTEILLRAKVTFNLNELELGISVRRHLKGKAAVWLVFNANETQALPPAVFAQQILQWADGTFEADNVYRILTPEEQDRITKRTGRAPLKEAHNTQNILDRDLRQREDLRRQGFDPKKEGLL